MSTPERAAPQSASLHRSRLFWPLAGLAALLLFNLAANRHFFDLVIRDGRLFGSLVDVFNRGSIVGLLALGMTLVIASGGVDLSVGSIMAIASSVAALGVTDWHLSFPAALCLALAAGALAGMCNGLLVGVVGIQPIVATLVLMVTGRGAAMLLTGGQVITFEDPQFVYLGNGALLGLPFTLTLLLIVLGLLALATRRTAAGLLLESLGDNETAARYCGVNTRTIKVAVYVVCGLCAGIAGSVAASNIKAADASRVGEMMELDAIFAVVVGGTALTGGRFTLLGSLIGALSIQTLTTTMYNLGVPSDVAPVPKAIVVLAVCLSQSPRFRQRLAGLFRVRARA